jgi:peptidoglycan/LPS O-acetylase OafA/YrhL
MGNEYNANKIHLSFLDGIRGIAILSVFLFHSLYASFGFDQLQWDGLFRDFEVSKTFLALFPFTYGRVGVAVFFVVSGFCIHLSYSRSSEKSWLYYANKRFFRIYPPYILAVVVFSFLWPWGSFHIDWPKLVQFVKHALAIHNFDQRTFFGINPSFWSIAIEIQLYLIYPILLIIAKKIGWKGALLLVGTIEIFIQGWSSIKSVLPIYPLPFYINYSPFAYWLSWSLGAYLCECFMTNKRSRIFQVRFDIIILIAIAFPLFKLTEPFYFLAFSYVTAIGIDRLISGKWTFPTNNRCFKWCWTHLSFLGVASYSFYLFHQPIINLISTLLAGQRCLIKYSVCLICYPIILLTAYLLYRLVEQPSIKFGQQYWQKLVKPSSL